jgi:hypothetical protein
MEPDLTQERQQAHALLDPLPPAKLGAVRSLLEVVIDDDDDLAEEDRAAIEAGLASSPVAKASLTKRSCASSASRSERPTRQSAQHPLELLHH